MDCRWISVRGGIGVSRSRRNRRSSMFYINCPLTYFSFSILLPTINRKSNIAGYRVKKSQGPQMNTCLIFMRAWGGFRKQGCAVLGALGFRIYNSFRSKAKSRFRRRAHSLDRSPPPYKSVAMWRLRTCICPKTVFTAAWNMTTVRF